MDKSTPRHEKSKKQKAIDVNPQIEADHQPNGASRLCAPPYLQLFVTSYIPENSRESTLLSPIFSNMPYHTMTKKARRPSARAVPDD